MIRVGVVGLGVGVGHIRAYAAMPGLFRVAAVCDLDAAKARAVADEHGIPHVAANLDALLQRDDLDLIDICTPSALHFDHASRALAAGFDVQLEKPIAGSLAEADALIAAEAASGKRVSVIFQYRWGSGLKRLQHLRARGFVGRAYAATVETHWRRRGAYYGGWRGTWAGELGGTLVTLAIHANDLLTHVLGPVKSVFARTATLVNPIETEDCAALVFEMADGALATHSVTAGAEENMSRLRFCFEGLTAESGRSPYHPTADPWTFTADDPDRQAAIDAAAAEITPEPGRFESQFPAVHAALTAGTPLPVTLADGRAALELITAIYHSARTGTAVTLPIADDHPLYQGWLPAKRARAMEGD